MPTTKVVHQHKLRQELVKVLKKLGHAAMAELLHEQASVHVQVILQHGDDYMQIHDDPHFRDHAVSAPPAVTYKGREAQAHVEGCLRNDDEAAKYTAAAKPRKRKRATADKQAV